VSERDVDVLVGAIDGEDDEHFEIVLDRVDPPARRVVADLRRHGNDWRLSARSPLSFDSLPLAAREPVELVLKAAQSYVWDMIDLEDKTRYGHPPSW
jgi:hypothetical protein